MIYNYNISVRAKIIHAAEKGGVMCKKQRSGFARGAFRM